MKVETGHDEALGARERRRFPASVPHEADDGLAWDRQPDQEEGRPDPPRLAHPRSGASSRHAEMSHGTGPEVATYPAHGASRGRRLQVREPGRSSDEAGKARMDPAFEKEYLLTLLKGQKGNIRGALGQRASIGRPSTGCSRSTTWEPPDSPPCDICPSGEAPMPHLIYIPSISGEVERQVGRVTPGPRGVHVPPGAPAAFRLQGAVSPAAAITGS